MSRTIELEHRFSFEAAHRLPNVPADHKCARLHGHSFQATIQVRGPLDDAMGWLLDYGEIKRFVEPLRRELDHHYLNEIAGLENPTSENIAIWIWQRLDGRLPHLAAVSIAETCRNSCTYRGE